MWPSSTPPWRTPCQESRDRCAALLVVLALPCTGNSPLPLTVSNNKALTNRLLSSFGIPTPAFRLYPSVPRGRTGLRFPVIVKPASEDGAAGGTEGGVLGEETG